MVALPAVRLKRWQARALRWLATAALVACIFWFVPLGEVVQSLRGVRLGYVWAGIAVSVAAHYLQAFQTWLLLSRIGMPIRTSEIFAINMTTRFYGQFLPSELMAGAVKLHRLAGPTKQWGEVVAALTFFRLANMLALVLLGLCFWAIERPSGAGWWVGIVMFALAAAILVLHVILSSRRTSAVLQRLVPSRGFSWLRGKVVDRVRGVIRTMVESYRVFGEVFVAIGTLAVARHLIGMVSFGLLALSVDVRLSYLTIGWLRVVMHVIMMLPISLAGIGVREGSLVVLLQEYAVPPGQAVALGLVLFANTALVTNALGGALELKNVLSGGRRAGAPQRSPE